MSIGFCKVAIFSNQLHCLPSFEYPNLTLIHLFVNWHSFNSVRVFSGSTWLVISLGLFNVTADSERPRFDPVRIFGVKHSPI